MRRPEGWLRPCLVDEGWVSGVSRGAFELAEPAGVEHPSEVRRHTPPSSLATLFELTAGRRVPPSGVGDVLVESILKEAPDMFEITVSRSGARPIVMVVLSTAPTRLFLCRTARGHYLSYRGTDPTQAEVKAVEDAAKHL